MQKVITVNIDPITRNKASYEENELELINKYLNEGYKVIDKFSTTSTTRFINLTFILEKGK